MNDLLWTVMSWIVNDGATWSEVKEKMRLQARRIRCSGT